LYVAYVVSQDLTHDACTPKINDIA
jgi:hypothetical protein